MSKPNSQPSGPVAVLAACSNSHPFEERRINVPLGEEQGLKIGRAVARILSAPNNAIFDCKVLSRNHATLWYSSEDEEFLIRDTKSSNGTFVNNERLSNSGEESAPKVLHSGDILQLGVEIIDNAKKVASGCIMCIVRLFNEKGEECLDNSQAGQPSLPMMRSEHIPTKYTLVRNDKLFIMEQYIKEARFRENLLGQKLQQLEEQLETAQEALKTSWHALINEEQLLSRIEILESQISLLGSRNSNPDAIRLEIQSIHEDRAKAEVVAKDTLRKAAEQLFETGCRLNEAMSGLFTTEEENAFLRRRCSEIEQTLAKQRNEHDELMVKYNDLLFNYNALEQAAKDTASTASANQSLRNEPGADQPRTIESGGREFRISCAFDDSILDETDNPPEPTHMAKADKGSLRSNLGELLHSTVATRREDALLVARIRQLLEDGVSENETSFPGRRMEGNLNTSTTTTGSALYFSRSNHSRETLIRQDDTQILLFSSLPLILVALAFVYPLLRIASFCASFMPATTPSASEVTGTSGGEEEGKKQK